MAGVVTEEAGKSTQRQRQHRRSRTLPSFGGVFSADLEGLTRAIPPCNTNPFSPETRQRPERVTFTPVKGASRYRQDFEEIRRLGKGSFGEVFAVRRRIDGCRYAVKKVGAEAYSMLGAPAMLQEVYALAAYSEHPHIVSYHSAWTEDSGLFIQMELCEQGSLGERLQQGVVFEEKVLRHVVEQISSALDHLHTRGAAHKDVKPDNIFVACNPAAWQHLVALEPPRPDLPAGFQWDSHGSYDAHGSYASHGIYKLGDLGLTTMIPLEGEPLGGPMEQEDIEGDSRYLSREILQNLQACDLKAADIFALGASVYELALGGRLPRDGPEWGQLREGLLHPVPGFTPKFVDMLKVLMHPNWQQRPLAGHAMQDPFVCRPDEVAKMQKMNTALAAELKEKQEVEQLQMKKLIEVTAAIQQLHQDLAHRGFTQEMLVQLERQAAEHAVASGSQALFGSQQQYNTH